MLKHKIAGIVIAGLFIGTSQAASIEHPSAGAEGGEAWGKVTYTFNPGAAQLTAQSEHIKYPSVAAEGGEAWGKVIYAFNPGTVRQGQASADTSVFPRAWTPFLD